MAAQTALWLPKAGADFELGKNKIFEPGPGEILVKVEAAAINPIDCTVQKGGFFLVEEYPAIIGEGGSGVVQKVSDGVTNLEEGDYVTFQSAYGVKYGTFQHYCLAVGELAPIVPENVSLVEAAPIAVCFNPFAVATYAQAPLGIGLTPPFEPDGLGKYANQPILIMGGATSLGQYAIQLAKLSGFHPIITTTSLKNSELLSSLGATHIISRDCRWHYEFKGKVKGITNAPLTYIFDAVSLKDTQEMAYDILAPGGTLAVVNQPLVEEDKANQKKVLMVYGTFHNPENRKLGAKFSKALTKWLGEGRIKPNAVEVLPGGLNAVANGLEILKKGVSAKKLVVRPPETQA